MSFEQPIPDDPFVDELLAPVSAPANDALKEAILRKTGAQLRRRRRSRLAVRVGLLAACFAGGMGAMALLHSREMPEPRTIIVLVPEESTPKAEAPVLEPRRSVKPAELELEAERTLVRAESALRFREAGDRYLRDEANYKAALRCYRNYLDETEETNPAVSEHDTWLLTSLVNARRKETANAQVNR
jgi:hypothetical protein